MAVDRLRSIASQIRPAQSGLSAVIQKNPDDVVITLAIRTPLTKGRKGGLKDTDLDAILFALFKEVLHRSNIKPDLIEDICLGNVADSRATYKCRAAALAAGIPHTAGASSVNRFCSSGLKATQDIAAQISLGSIEIGLAVGGESMSHNDGRELPFSSELMDASQEVVDLVQHMIQTSENVSTDNNISRQEQDEYAVESFRRAEVAQKAGWFDDEIVPIRTQMTDPATGKSVAVCLTQDEGPRYGTDLEKLAKIKPAMPQLSMTTTGGNASQVTDGAAALLMMKRSKALALKQPILAKFCGATVTGVPPRIMGVGPAFAIPKLLAKFHLTKDEVDIYEINEAFGSMAVYCLKTLGLDHKKLNPRGGAIALGHPLGATGIRQVCTGLSEARRQKKHILVTSMCIGTGQGMAGLFVNEQL